MQGIHVLEGRRDYHGGEGEGYDIWVKRGLAMNIWVALASIFISNGISSV